MMLNFLELELHGEKRAYPILILNWHEIVNDVVGGVPVTVSYCPLCGTGTAFHRSFSGVNTTFGVSGLLYNSDLLLYDRGSESLWSQILGQAVSGNSRGSICRTCPSSIQPGKPGKRNILGHWYFPRRQGLPVITADPLTEIMMRMVKFIFRFASVVRPSTRKNGCLVSESGTSPRHIHLPNWPKLHPP